MCRPTVYIMTNVWTLFSVFILPICRIQKILPISFIYKFFVTSSLGVYPLYNSSMNDASKYVLKRSSAWQIVLEYSPCMDTTELGVNQVLIPIIKKCYF